MKIKIENIIPDPDQPRKTFDMEKIIELLGSVESLGLIQPITVRPCGDGKYMVVVGERRFRATQLDGSVEIDCIVREDVDDKKAREMQFAENTEHEDVPVMELAESVFKHCEMYSMNQSQFASASGMSQTMVARLFALSSKLCHGIKSLVESGKLDGRAAYEISRLPSPELQERVAKEVVDKDLAYLTTAKVVQLAKAVPTRSVESIVEQVRYNQDVEKVNHRELVNEIKRQSVPKPLPVEGKYRTISIDPPWPIEKVLRDNRPNQFDIEYPTMTLDEIADLPIPRYASEDGCHIYLWTTHKHLPDALALLEGWEAKYQCLLTWVKNVGFTPFSFMYSTEHCLFAHIGSLPLLQMGKRLDFSAKVREHSRKPNEFYDLVKSVSPEPRLDMFGREQREGFTVWGNEDNKFKAEVVV